MPVCVHRVLSCDLPIVGTSQYLQVCAEREAPMGHMTGCAVDERNVGVGIRQRRGMCGLPQDLCEFKKMIPLSLEHFNYEMASCWEGQATWGPGPPVLGEGADLHSLPSLPSLRPRAVGGSQQPRRDSVTAGHLLAPQGRLAGASC